MSEKTSVISQSLLKKRVHQVFSDFFKEIKLDIFDVPKVMSELNQILSDQKDQETIENHIILVIAKYRKN